MASSAIELQSAYLTLIPTLKGALPSVRKELEGSGIIEEVAAPIDKAAGQGLINGFKSALKGGAIAVAATAATGLAYSLTKGFQRLDGLDQATAKLTGLGHSAESVERIMDNALASVKGTAFGMADAAQVASGVVAAGIKPGEDLERTLKLVADGATIAGISMGEMGSIFNKVAAGGLLQGEEIAQLGDRGIPILQLLADELGVTALEAKKMASEGKIDFATFQNAMEAGMGGAALESGNTFSGAMANASAAAGRLGESLLKEIFPDMTNGFKGIIEGLDGLQPAFENAGKVIKDVFDGVRNTITGVVDFVKANKDWIAPIAVGIGAATAALVAWNVAVKGARVATNLAAAAQLVFNAVMNANPIMLVVTAIAALVAGLVYFFTQTELGQQIWQGFVEGLGAAWDWLWTSVLSPVIDAIVAAFTWLWETILKPIFDGIVIAIIIWQTIMTALWEGFIQPILDSIATAFQFLWDYVLKPIIDFIVGYYQMWGAIFTWLYENVIKPVIDGIAAVFNWLWTNAIKPVIDWINGALETVGTVTEGVFRGMSDFIKGIFDGLVAIIKAPINAIIDFFNMAIDGLNSIRIDVPEWAQGLLGGATVIGFDIPNIPRLAEGGIVEAVPGGILANVGEGRYDEAVLPLGGRHFERFTTALADALGGDGEGMTVNIYPEPGRTEMQVLADFRSRRAAW